MSTTSSPSGTATPSGGARASLRVDLWLLVIMLALALVGVGLTQLEKSGGRYYWLLLVVVYGGISIVRSWQKAKARGGDLSMVWKEALHWLGAMVAINIVLIFESAEIASRVASADYSLLVLALSCYLAGVHFNWGYALLGGILAVMAVGLGYLDQITLLGMLVPLCILAVWVFAKYKLGKSR
jgi:hypothetical protein